MNGFTHTDLENCPRANLSLSGAERMQEVTGFDFAESDPAFGRVFIGTNGSGVWHGEPEDQ